MSCGGPADGTFEAERALYASGVRCAASVAPRFRRVVQRGFAVALAAGDPMWGRHVDVSGLSEQNRLATGASLLLPTSFAEARGRGVTMPEGFSNE